MSSRLPSDQQRFEGPNLEEVLKTVRASAGTSARIIAANKLRRGGVGGFFAKEAFEVIIERPADMADAAITPVAAETPPAKRGRRGGAAAARRVPASVNRLNELIEGVEQRAAAHAMQQPTSLLDLVDAMNDEERGHNVVDLPSMERANEVAVPVVSTETERFTSILERIAADVGAGERERTREADAETEIDAIDAIEVIEVIEVIEDAISLDAPPAAPPANTMSRTMPFVAPRVRRHARDAEVLERPENTLARLGLPPRYIPRGTRGTQLRGALIESLAALPAAAPLPDAPGVVIAVVGVGSRPAVLARLMAGERGLDPDAVMLATQAELGEGVPSWLQINDPAAAEERRRSWRRRDTATFVAVSLPAVTSNNDWAREMLDNLEPTEVWGIAHAAWKPDDVDAWSQRLGGFDVLALDRLSETVSPAAALALDMPVGRLDGAPATPLRWSELLLERVVIA